MANVKGRPGSQPERDVGAALDRARQAQGLTQAELAVRLGTSQATVSKILRSMHAPRPRLDRAIREFVTMETDPEGGSQDAWVAAVTKAAARHPAFKALVTSALKLLNDNE